MFVQLAPPSWAKRFLVGAPNGVLGDDSREAKLMRGHLFNLAVVSGVVVLAHSAIYVFFYWKRWKLSPVLQAPGVEIKVFFVVIMVVYLFVSACFGLFRFD
jgi:hypothetical protein